MSYAMPPIIGYPLCGFMGFFMVLIGIAILSLFGIIVPGYAMIWSMIIGFVIAWVVAFYIRNPHFYLGWRARKPVRFKLDA